MELSQAFFTDARPIHRQRFQATKLFDSIEVLVGKLGANQVDLRRPVKKVCPRPVDKRSEPLRSSIFCRHATGMSRWSAVDGRVNERLLLRYRGNVRDRWRYGKLRPCPTLDVVAMDGCRDQRNEAAQCRDDQQQCPQAKGAWKNPHTALYVSGLCCVQRRNLPPVYKGVSRSHSGNKDRFG